MEPMSFISRSGLLVLASAVVGCGTPGAPLPDDVKDPARRIYYEGMRELADGDYAKATTLFQAVAASPRHVKHASLAKLRLGDALYFQGRYAEATEIYRGFVQQHNSDPNIPYARFRTAQCYYARLPSEWFATPPAHEFDQTITTQTEAELKGFITTFPTSVYTPEARRMLASTRKMLFSHEVYAIDFYADQGKWQAVAWRLRDAIDAYPELGMTDGYVWRMAMAWEKVAAARQGDESKLARNETARALGLYLSKFPSGEHHAAATQKLDAIRRAIELESKPKELPPPPEPKPVPAPQVTPEPEAPGELELKPPEMPPAPE